MSELNESLESIRGQQNVTFEFVRSAEPIHLKFDLDALTWEDNIKFAAIQEKIEAGTVSSEEGLEAMADLLSKLVGRDIRKLPMMVVTSILAEFQKLTQLRTEEAKN